MVDRTAETIDRWLAALPTDRAREYVRNPSLVAFSELSESEAGAVARFGGREPDGSSLCDYAPSADMPWGNPQNPEGRESAGGETNE